MVIKYLFMLYRLHHVMTRHTAFDACLLIWIYLYTYTYLYTPLGIHLNIYWEFLTPLDLHVQILKLGLKWSPPPKIKLTSRSRLTSPGSFRT